MSAPVSVDARHSSHDFVRTLRSASDPPLVGGRSKIEIAQEAWANPFFYVPSKAEVIADWILTKLLKDKAKEIPLNPIFDVRYWQLLLKLFKPQKISLKNAVSRPEKTWLMPLLHRVPLGPIVVAFLGLFQGLDEAKKEDLSNAVNSCLAILWPIAVQRIATETLQECFGSLLSTCALAATSAGISKIGYTICNSYRTSLTNSSNKKKLYHTFVQLYLKAWIQCIENLPDTSLRKAMLDAGVETLLNLDILRQSLDPKGESPLLDRLQNLVTEDRDLVLKVLPVLFEIYVNALKKNRSALFSQGSQPQPGSGLGELHNAALCFFISILYLIDHSHQDHQAWAARLALLQTIDRENIFNRKHVETQVAFDQIIDLALVRLGEAWKEDNLDDSGVVVPCLSTIARIEYDLILPFIPRILPLLLHVSIPSKPYFEFLDILLNYHTKTRTMGTFVQGLLSAISDADAVGLGCLKAYQLSFSSPIMHSIFLDRLSKALQYFLTESQCQTTISLLFANLTRIWHLFDRNTRQLETESSESPKKKRKTESTENSNAEELAVTYSLICRLASAVMSSLPIHSLSLDALKSVKDSVLEFRTNFIDQAVLKSIKAMKKHVDMALWSSEVTLAATLRLLYALNVSRNLSLPDSYDEKRVKKLIGLAANDDLLPELTLELFRTLFCYLSCGNQLDKEVVEHFLRFIEKNFTGTDIHWSGQSHHLTKGEPGRAESALAVLHLVIERWLPEIDRLASADQLKRLLQVVISIKMSPINWSRQQMEPGLLLVELLHSAQFWEFRNIRNAFLSLLDEMTALLASIGFKLLDSSSIISKEVHVYRHLLLFPMEYFSWQLLDDLTKRCISADMALGPLLSPEDVSIIEDLTVLRIFLKRVLTDCNSVPQDLVLESSEFFIHLLMPSHGADKGKEFLKATLELAETCLAKLLKASKKNGSKAMLDVLASIKSDIFCKPLDMSALAVVQLVGLLERDFLQSRIVTFLFHFRSISYSKYSLPAEVTAAIGQLHQDTLLSLVPQLEFISEIHFSSQDEVEKYSNIVSGWHTLLCLQDWLAQSGNQVQNLKITGRKLTSHLVSWLKSADRSLSQECEKLCVDVFAILLKELESLPGVKYLQQLDIIISVYIVFSDFLSVAGRKNMEIQLARMCRKLAVSNYVHVLSFISDSLSSHEHVTGGHIQHLVNLASLALHEHPTHSLVHVQNFATRCLSIFDSHPVFVQGPRDLRLRVLDMIFVHCSDQQAALRLADAAAIWLLLSRYLAPSGTHDNETDVATFHKIVSIIGSLIRLRRDLVSHALPHLSGILRQLLFCLRACRPNLGGKQTTLVMASLPRWINAKYPLGAEEAKALGRLLESLTTKTVVRFLGSSSTETQKAESLAKPFSKHAAYVLDAYIESMNDPLCVLSLETRKEFQAGLFALCSIISEHSRDSLMISALDSGGKAVLKALWKEYEKQRYVGKG